MMIDRPASKTDAPLSFCFVCVGESEYQFTMVIHPSDIDSARKIDTPGSRISSLAINDDIEGDEADEERSVEAIKCVCCLHLGPSERPSRADMYWRLLAQVLPAD